ncbi:MAG: preprotein translocase subunit SecY [Mycoplasmataceae bacterium]|nr:preprotein translocase subunit SecY [Mycoplasmataceae bacterium]
MSNNEDEWFDSKEVKETKITKVKKTSKDGKFSIVKTKITTTTKMVGSKIASGTKFALEKANSKPLIKKILFTLLLILIFRIAASITTPGVTVKSGFGKDDSSFVGIMNMMGGGTLKNFSILALGISPYIMSSVIMTLLQSEVFPPLHRLSKSGPAGKRKINIITRVLTLAFAIIQSMTIIAQLSGGQFVTLQAPFNTTLYKYFALPAILIAGSMFTIFLGEQINKKGVGNGTSLIIFSGIAVAMPSKFKLAYEELVTGNGSQSILIGLMNFGLYIGVFLILLYIIGYLYKAERHVPIQQTGAGLTKAGGKISHLPIKLNPAGVMPVIFALSISIIPVTVVQLIDRQNEGRQWVEANMKLTALIGLLMLIGLTFIFTIAMSLLMFNPFNVADSFKKNGTFIPGIKPGEQTEKYLTSIILRLATFSAIYLSFITSIKYVEQILGLSANITLGGTSLIILATVSIETISQLKARDQTRKITKAKQKSISKHDGSVNTGGLLW